MTATTALIIFGALAITAFVASMVWAMLKDNQDSDYLPTATDWGDTGKQIMEALEEARVMGKVIIP